MPRFFDDYSNTYLTHDSSAGRKQQRRGWKFRENFRLHYQPHVDEWRRGRMGLAAAQQTYIRAKGVHDPAIPPLPTGWKEELDEVTGISYYIDTKASKSRTWVRPGFIPPPPGGGPRGGGGPQQQNRGPPPPGYNRGPPPPMMQQQQQQHHHGGGGPPPVLPPPPMMMQQQQQHPGGGGGPPVPPVPQFYQLAPGQALPGAPPPPPHPNLPPPPGGPPRY